MSEDFGLFLILAALVAYIDLLNRRFRKWYRASTGKTHISFFASLVLFTLALNLAYIPATLTAWLLSFFVA